MGAQKNKSAMRSRTFYRLRDSPATSLRLPYDMQRATFLDTSLTIPGNVGKQYKPGRERVIDKMVGLRLPRRGALATVRVQKG